MNHRKTITGTFALLALAIILLLAETAKGQKQALNTFLSGNAMKHASVSFLAVDLNKGDTLLQHRSGTSLCPASVTKIISTATALELFGAAHTFSTVISYSGKIENGVLNGNIYITGGGDPALGSKNFEYYSGFIDKWADAISFAGIKRINGKVVADVSWFASSQVPDGWTWGDIGNYFGAAPLSLNVYDNEFTITFKTGTKPGDSTSVVSFSPVIPYMKFINRVKTGNVSGDNSMIYGSVTDNTRTAEGFLPPGRNAFEVRGAIPMPPLLLAEQVRTALALKGISSDTSQVIFQSDTVKTKVILSFPSVTLAEIINVTNKSSMNLYAETLFRQAGKKLSPNNPSPSDAVSEFWKDKINTSGFFIEDGSGLSRSNAFTAGNLVELLRYMKKSKNFEVFYNSLPVAGKSGTISSMFNGTIAEDNLRAKSGSLNRVRCYAGYLTTRSGKEVAFALLVNNFSCSQSEMKSRIEKLLVAVCEQ